MGTEDYGGFTALLYRYIKELHRDTRALVGHLMELEISKNEGWKGMIAITRGGLVPAAIVAREMEIRLIDTVCISYHGDGGETQGSLNIEHIGNC